MFRAELSPLWDPSLRYGLAFQVILHHTHCVELFEMFSSSQAILAGVNCEPNNNRGVERSRSTREARDDHHYSAAVVPIVSVLVNSIKRVCVWLIIDCWILVVSTGASLPASLWRTDVCSFYLMQYNILPAGLVPLSSPVNRRLYLLILFYVYVVYISICFLKSHEHLVRSVLTFGDISALYLLYQTA